MTEPARHYLDTVLRPFVPHRWLRNGHAMTVYAWARRRTFDDVPSPEPRLFRVAADSEVLAHCYWQPSRADRPTLLVLHGLEGSSEAHYMRALAAKAWRRGWNAVLLNQRNCGGTERLTPTLYHSGLTADPHTVLRTLVETDGLRLFGIIGYSLGGNLAVKLAGELGASPDVPLAGVVAISPTIDLDVCVRAIERRANLPYHFNFVRHLKARMRRKAQAWPGVFDLTPLGGIWTIRRFDDVYTAPLHGFGNASNYYAQASAGRVVSNVRIPTLLLSAEDDSFVPASQFQVPDVRDNPNIAVSITAHGGHCAFIAEAREGNDGYWAEETALAFIDSAVGS